MLARPRKKWIDVIPYLSCRILLAFYAVYFYGLNTDFRVNFIMLPLV
jgi:hypothetical protein